MTPFLIKMNDSVRQIIIQEFNQSCLTDIPKKLKNLPNILHIFDSLNLKSIFDVIFNIPGAKSSFQGHKKITK